MDFWSQKLDWTYCRCLKSTRTTYLNCSFLPTLALQNQDMCHDTIGSTLIEI